MIARVGWPLVLLAAACRAHADPPAGPAPAGADDEGVQVVVRGTDEKDFPEIGLDFEVRRADGSALLDARREDFRVTEYGQPVEILRFAAPLSREIRPATVVLVIDKSGSMIEDEDRFTPLRQAVAAFLEVMPAGSQVAVVAFSSDVQVICPFTAEPDRVREAVDAVRVWGKTRFFDAVDRALGMIEDRRGRRAVIALTDGEDNASGQALRDVVARARTAGVPVYTLGVGSEDAINAEDLRRLAAETRGQYYPARQAEQLRGLYVEMARGLGERYSLTYRSDRRLPDGTLRPVQIFYRGGRQAAGQAEVFIRGMVVPAANWSRLFLALVGALLALALLPGLLRPRRPAA